jgi:hypothetical protein
MIDGKQKRHAAGLTEVFDQIQNWLPGLDD